MRYLIDGYNLLHKMGLLLGGRDAGPDGLQRARLDLLDRLSHGHGEHAAQVTVVFDAARPPRGAAAEFDYHGLHVAFAVGKAEADDLIEDLIRRDSRPARLTVVSDDHRLQEAARRRSCPVLGCMDYLDHLERPTPPLPDEPPAKPESVSGAEAEHWLREFADLPDDPWFTEWDEGEPKDEGPR
jgi:hypothetical protein